MTSSSACHLTLHLTCLVGSAGRLEFAAYLPPNCQAALIQPVGKDGVLVVGSDTQRGFSRLDQVREGVMRDAVLVAGVCKLGRNTRSQPWSAK